jgi:hypothetical protein
VFLAVHLCGVPKRYLKIFGLSVLPCTDGPGGGQTRDQNQKQQYAHTFSPGNSVRWFDPPIMVVNRREVNARCVKGIT